MPQKKPSPSPVLVAITVAMFVFVGICMLFGFAKFGVTLLVFWCGFYVFNLYGGGDLPALDGEQGQEPRLVPKPIEDPTAIPTPLADLLANAATHTTGLVGVGAEPVVAPLGGQPCAWFRCRVEDIERGEVLYAACSADDIVLDDGQGARVRVHVDGATFKFSRSLVLDSPPHERNGLVARFLAERGIDDTDRNVRATLEWIMPHELVFVRGFVTPSSSELGMGAYRSGEKTELCILATKEHPVTVSLDALGERDAA